MNWGQDIDMVPAPPVHCYMNRKDHFNFLNLNLG